MIHLHHSWAYIQRNQSQHTVENTCSRFIVALFTIAKSWNQPRCPSVEEWIKKIWYIHTVTYYLAIKNKNCVICRKLEIMMLSEINQTQK
jgi:hypothetical protein